MAKYIPSIPLIENITEYVPTDSVSTATNVASKLMRFKILSDRQRPQFNNTDTDGGPQAYEFERSTGMWETKKHIQTLIENGNNNLLIDNTGYTHEEVRSLSTTKINDINNKKSYDKISIIDFDYNNKDIFNKKYRTITLPFVPRELRYSMASRFVGIATIGRNNPYYQFTGSEDTLEFEIDWFSEIKNREDVITNCRWLESLTKSNAYNDTPHRITLVWGNNNKLWRNDIWIVTSANYVLSDFVRGYKESRDSEFVNTNLLPQQARQQIVLKRVASINRTTEDILGQLNQNGRLI